MSDHVYLYFTLWFIFACLALWQSKRENAQMHERTQQILRDIARFLGTDRR